MIAIFCRITGLDHRKVRYACNRLCDPRIGQGQLAVVAISSIVAFFAFVIGVMAQ